MVIGDNVERHRDEGTQEEVSRELGSRVVSAFCCEGEATRGGVPGKRGK